MIWSESYELEKDTIYNSLFGLQTQIQIQIQSQMKREWTMRSSGILVVVFSYLLWPSWCKYLRRELNFALFCIEFVLYCIRFVRFVIMFLGGMEKVREMVVVYDFVCLPILAFYYFLWVVFRAHLSSLSPLTLKWSKQCRFVQHTRLIFCRGCVREFWIFVCVQKKVNGFCHSHAVGNWWVGRARYLSWKWNPPQVTVTIVRTQKKKVTNLKFSLNRTSEIIMNLLNDSFNQTWAKRS